MRSWALISSVLGWGCFPCLAEGGTWGLWGLLGSLPPNSGPSSWISCLCSLSPL